MSGAEQEAADWRTAGVGRKAAGKKRMSEAAAGRMENMSGAEQEAADWRTAGVGRKATAQREEGRAGNVSEAGQKAVVRKGRKVAAGKQGPEAGQEITAVPGAARAAITIKPTQRIAAESYS